MKELTLDDLQKAGIVMHRCVPELPAVFVLGSGAVSALHPEIEGRLRQSVDVDFSPIDRPVFHFESKFVDKLGGQESEFFAENEFYIDYVIPDVFRCTPPGWQQRVTIIDLAPGLKGHCLDPHDVAYNKLWAGRAKDITWVHGLLGTGIITMERLLELHASNPIADAERLKVDASLRAVRALL